MKKLLSVVFLFSLFLIFSGCPYESKVPIDAPSLLISTKLLGEWQEKGNPDIHYKITKNDATNCRIEKSNIKSKGKEVEKFLAYSSQVNNTTFVNVSEYKPDAQPDKYLLYKFELSKEGVIMLTEVTDNIVEKFETSMDLKKFIAANMQNSYFFNKEQLILIRVEN